MIKIYKVYSFVSIDNADWCRVGGFRYRVTSEDVENMLILENLSFDEAYEYLLGKSLCGIYSSSTSPLLGKSKSIINIEYNDSWCSVKYKHFEKISYKIEFSEWNDVTLNWIIKNLPADECIQYLKERGITACPIIK